MDKKSTTSKLDRISSIWRARARYLCRVADEQGDGPVSAFFRQEARIYRQCLDELRDARGYGPPANPDEANEIMDMCLKADPEDSIALPNGTIGDGDARRIARAVYREFESRNAIRP